ncbi:cytochrome P450 [Trichoderma barbatum]
MASQVSSPEYWPLDVSLRHFARQEFFIGLTSLALLSVASYRLFFHPLAKYPGPILAGLSEFWFIHKFFKGYVHLSIGDLHRTYGHAVRIGPNELSFDTIKAQNTIYHEFAETFAKSGLIGNAATKSYFNPANLLTLPTGKYHQKMRKIVGQAFAPRSLLEQEGFFHTHIDKLASVLADASKQDKVVDLHDLLVYVAWDIVGDLSFGQPFGALDNGQNDPWLTQVSEHIPMMMKMVELLDALPIQPIVRWCFGVLNLPLAKHRDYCMDKLKRRLATQTDRKDFVSYIHGQIPDDQLLSEMSMLVLAGSETSSTVGTAIFYHLISSPPQYRRLQEELHSAFSSAADITGPALSSLPFLNAVVDEGLRIAPPVPGLLRRKCPGAIVEGQFVPSGTIVSVSNWAIHHSENYFEHPDDFMPERWLDPDSKDTKQANRAFSIGARSCIGREMAITELRLILAKLVYKFDMQLQDTGLDWHAKAKWYWIWTDAALRIKVQQNAKGFAM